MKLLNCNIRNVKNEWCNRKIYFFGAGSWVSVVKYTEIMQLKRNFQCVLDNSKEGKIVLEDVELDIVSPNCVIGMDNIVILLCSSLYMYDMYVQLKEMNLGDNVFVYALPFMLIESQGDLDKDIFAEIVKKKEKDIIPKTIHGFWFSGEDKPDSYKRCVETWYKVLPDYNIIEWNKDNYPIHSHPFLDKAIECEAWAFASDFARLDVLEKYGGIYLDMDVEVLKPFDDLLGNETILSFANNAMIDLAVLGAKKNSIIVSALKRKYNELNIPQNRNDFIKYYQPSLIRDSLHELGVVFNGSLQKINGGIVLPNTFFMPMEHVLFREYSIYEHTYCVHMDNFGWNYDGEDKRLRKIRDNNILWSMIEKVEGDL